MTKVVCNETTIFYVNREKNVYCIFKINVPILYLWNVDIVNETNKIDFQSYVKYLI